MKQKKYAILLLATLIGLITCKKDKQELSNNLSNKMYPSIKSIQPDSARRYDTVLITFSTNKALADSQKKYLMVYVAGIQANIINFVDNNKVQIRIPGNAPIGKDIWSENGYALKLMYKSESSSFASFFTYSKPEIKSVYPLQGKAGDIINIKGIDLKSIPYPKYLINTLPCEVVDSTDTLVKVKVPLGAGNGNVCLWNYDCGSPFWYHKYKIICTGPVFTYQFANVLSKQYASKVYESGTTYIITRDAGNRVSRRNIQGTNKYEIFKYGSNGLLDSVKYFTADTLSGYSVYYGDTSSLWTEDRFNYQGVKYKQQKYFYNSGCLSKIMEYVSDGSGGFYLQIESDYVYLGEGNIIYSKTFASNGNITSSVTYHPGYDKKNRVFDIYAPGFPRRYQYNQTIAPAGEIQYVYYNEFGNMNKMMTLSSCTNIFTTYEIEYAQ